ncbi:hypothetical protein CERZMDRAFT_118139 [Cercospora zeae-maydis SCOH1-5]|uniref:F-box domain-containing protein n=1 Tax=Cercospora zeae-maydis SCOH1-5 TaxID=717836 RepID=A0A6A6FB17_9PEZI|nr:hypothetical protein CERZMDRAFT_118139 [Cercospora zeae-maydis SCOH1-5]
MAVSEAAQQVGRIAEVVASLVEHLDMVDVAGAQRVSQTWRYEIDRSPICQEKMFKIPSTRHEKIAHGGCEPRVGLQKLEYSVDQSDNVFPRKGIVCLHPFLEMRRDLNKSMCVKVDPKRLPVILSGAPGYMLLTQPPTREAIVEVEYVFDEGPYLGAPRIVEYIIHIQLEDYIRFRDLSHELIEPFRSSHCPDFWEWLPEAYYHHPYRRRAAHPITLDDYITSYGYPRPRNVHILFNDCIEAGADLLLQVRQATSTLGT